MVTPNKTKPVAPTTAPTAPTKGTAPSVATVATTVALGSTGPNANNVASNGAAVAVGNVCTVASMGTVWHFVALHAAPTTCANPAAWPPLYTVAGGTVAHKPGAPSGSNGLPYTTHAVAVPASGPAVWGVVHCYPGMRPLRGTNAAASNPGNGTMVATPAPLGARIGGAPCAATMALAKRLGL